MDRVELIQTAERLFQHYHLSGWSFGFARTKRRLGVCKHGRKRIEINEYYASHNPRESVLDTLLHEIAHALAGPRAGHGPRWKAIAAQLGATPRACDDSPATVQVPGDWQARCPSCGRVYHRYRRPPFRTGYRCRCAARTVLTFEYHGDPRHCPDVPMTRAQSVGNWQAICDGCGTLHHRYRKPRPGVWRCRCPSRTVLTWVRPT